MADNLPGELADLLVQFGKQSYELVSKFVDPWTSAPEPDLLFHYTSEQSAEAILKSGTLWLSDVFQMNDPSELRYGVEYGITLAKEMIKAHGRGIAFFEDHYSSLSTEGIETSAKYFVASFSTDSDEIGQWRAYANDGKGVALGFDGTALEQAFAYERPPKKDGSSYPLFYGDAEVHSIQEQITQLLVPLVSATRHKDYDDAVILEYLIELFRYHAAAMIHASLYFKHPAYSSESEYRFIRIRSVKDAVPDASIRSTIHGPCRYVTFDWRRVAVHALREIVIGPAADGAAATKWLERVLDENRYDRTKIVIRKSPMPYRSFRA